MTKLNKYISSNYQDFFDKNLSLVDPEIYSSIKYELERQQEHIELIASENIVSKAVLDAQGSIMTNKYAEGYPSKRYYGGCEFVDKAEDLAIERVKKLFNCKYANVQPHSGAQANGAVYLALLNPGDTILGMSLNSGGHLTHGAKVSLSGKWSGIPCSFKSWRHNTWYEFKFRRSFNSWSQSFSFGQVVKFISL